MIRPGSQERSLRIALVVAGDFLAAWASLAAIVAIRRAVPLPFTRHLLSTGSFLFTRTNVVLFGGALVAALGLSGFYRQRVMARARPIVMVALLIQVALVSIGSAVLEAPLPRSLLAGVPLFEALILPFWRWLQQALWPVRPRETLLVGAPAAILAAHAVLAGASDHRIRVIGYAGPANASPSIDDEIPWLGPLEDPAVRAAVRDAEELIYVGEESGPGGRLDLLRIRGPRGYLLLASPADALLMSSMLGWMGDEPLIEISVGCGYGFRAIVKRIIDIAGALALLVVAVPVGLAIGLAIAIDSGRPIFLRQQRRGLGGASFGMWKFRSMRARIGVDADDTDRARVTRVGRFLRRYRLDELPQLINVLTGEMSLVGPRPEQPDIAERILEEVPDFDLRCLVRPGIAGLAQILAEYDSRPAVKLRYDLTYMCSWSVWLDIRLLFSSVAAALSGSGI